MECRRGRQGKQTAWHDKAEMPQTKYTYATQHVPIRPLPNRFRAVEIANRPRAPRRRRGGGGGLRRRDHAQGISPIERPTPAPSYGPTCHGSMPSSGFVLHTWLVVCGCLTRRTMRVLCVVVGGGWAFG